MSRAVDRRALVLCEVALLGVTLAVTGGFARVFENGSFFPKLATLAVVSHVVALALRRLGRGIIVSGVVSFAGLCVTAGLLFYPSTTALGLPTFATRDAARIDLDAAWKLFGEVRAPAPVHPGFVLAAGLALWIVAFLADWAAFRLWSPAEAVTPAGVVFLFCSLQSAKTHQITSTTGFAAAVLVFVLLHRVARQDAGASWLATEPSQGRSSVVRMGMLVGAAALITGVVVGPALPGADEAAVVPWRDIGKNATGDHKSRVTVSPLVTIRSRLVDQSTVEAFTVQSPEPEYWRLTALDKFDGTAWTSSGQYETARGQLPSRLPPNTPIDTIQQTFDVEALDSLWLPAAYEPEAVVDEGGTRPSYEAESGTLTIGDKVKTAQGLSYVVQSRVPRRDAATISRSPGPVPQAITDRYTALPAGFSARVVNLANRVVAGQRTPYEKAKALQDWFLDNFTYNLNVQLGHGTEALEKFLAIKTGYCEQFASAYAAMARAVGLPARVAVGFTPGELEADGLYHVRGEHAHAWPEVYLGSGVGWLRFEPTPGRGAPGDEAYTGVPPQQVEPGDSGAATAVPDTTAPPTTSPATDPSVDPALPNLDSANSVATNDGLTPPAPRSAWSRLAELVLALAAVAAAVAVLIPAAKAVRATRRRRRLARTTRGRVELAWADAVDVLALLDVPVDTSATPAEVAARAVHALGPDAGQELSQLAALTTEARYAPGEPDGPAVKRATAAARQVHHHVVRRVSRARRVRRLFDPRPLLPRSDGGPDRRAGRPAAVPRRV